MGHSTTPVHVSTDLILVCYMLASVSYSSVSYASMSNASVSYASLTDDDDNKI